MLNYTKKEEMTKAVEGLKVSTNMEIYKEIDIELKRLWKLEELARSVFEQMPTSGNSHYPHTSLEHRVKDKLEKTKELLKRLGTEK